MEIYFSTKKKKYQEYEDLFLLIFKQVIKDLSLNQSLIVSCDLVSRKNIKKLNQQYRHLNKVTDVLSFAYLENINNREELLTSSQHIEIGDIIISYQRAKRQAKKYAHSLKRELSFLFLHGTLHLLGYDHQNEEEEKEMFALQERILNEMKIKT